MVLECLLPKVAGVHKIGHEPIPIFFSEVGIETSLRVFNIVAQFQRRPDITAARREATSLDRADAATPLLVFVSRFAQGSPTKISEIFANQRVAF